MKYKKYKRLVFSYNGKGQYTPAPHEPTIDIDPAHLQTIKPPPDMPENAVNMDGVWYVEAEE